MRLDTRHGRKWEFHGFLKVFQFRSKFKIGFYCLLLLLPPPFTTNPFIQLLSFIQPSCFCHKRSCKKNNKRESTIIFCSMDWLRAQ